MTYTRDEIISMDADQLRRAIAEQIQKPYQLKQWDWKFTCPDWPRSIEAAWELLEEMALHMPTVAVVKLDSGKWYCSGNISDTAPLAIARAYLLYKHSA